MKIVGRLRRYFLFVDLALSTRSTSIRDESMSDHDAVSFQHRSSFCLLTSTDKSIAGFLRKTRFHFDSEHQRSALGCFIRQKRTIARGERRGIRDARCTSWVKRKIINLIPDV
jgi:hypothetical protein